MTGKESFRDLIIVFANRLGSAQQKAPFVYVLFSFLTYSVLMDVFFSDPNPYVRTEVWLTVDSPRNQSWCNADIGERRKKT